MKTGNGKTGRPIGFDRDSALEAAMLLFWERGYEGTSMADLTHAMGLNPSSIYAAFGDKHALFQLVVKRYMKLRAQYAAKALEEPTLEKVHSCALRQHGCVPHHARPSADLHDAGGGGGLQSGRHTGKRSHDGDSETESSRYKGAPSQSTKERRVAEENQRR